MQPKKLNMQGSFALKLGGMIGMGKPPPIKKVQVQREEQPFEEMMSTEKTEGTKEEESAPPVTMQDAQKTKANMRATNRRKPPTRKPRVATSEVKEEEHPIDVDPNVDYLAKLDKKDEPEKAPEETTGDRKSTSSASGDNATDANDQKTDLLEETPKMPKEAPKPKETPKPLPKKNPKATPKVKAKAKGETPTTGTKEDSSSTETEETTKTTPKGEKKASSDLPKQDTPKEPKKEKPKKKPKDSKEQKDDTPTTEEKPKEEKPKKEKKPKEPKPPKEKSPREEPKPKEEKPKKEKKPKEPKPPKEESPREEPKPKEEKPKKEKKAPKEDSPREEPKATKEEKPEKVKEPKKYDTKREKKKPQDKNEVMESIKSNSAVNSKNAQVQDALSMWMGVDSNAPTTMTPEKKFSKRIVILGGGTAGLLALKKMYHLAEEDTARIFLIEPNYCYIPHESVIYSLTNNSPVDTLKRDYTHLNFPKVSFVHDTPVFIDTDQRTVHIKSGSVKFDYLVLSSNSVPHNSVPGLTEASFDIFDAETLHNVKKLVPSLTGDIVLTIQSEESLPDPFFAYHFAFLLNDYLVSSGFQHKLHLVASVASPLLSFGSKFSEFISERLGLAKITNTFSSTIDSVDYCTREIKTTKLQKHGEKIVKISKNIQYGLLLSAFPRKGSDFLDHSGLLNDDGYVPASPESLLVDDEENIFVLGDCAQLELPYGDNNYLQKGYNFYKKQAAVVASRIEQSLLEKTEETSYDGKMEYQIYVGKNEYVDVEAEFLPQLNVSYKTSQKNVKRTNELETKINKYFN